MMITRKVKLAFVGGLDLIYIHKPLSHTGLHSHSPQKPQPHTQIHGQKKNLVERQFLKKFCFFFLCVCGGGGVLVFFFCFVFFIFIPPPYIK